MDDLFKLDERIMHHIKRDILGKDPGFGPLENLDDFLENPEGGAPQTCYNSWPFGEETDEVFRRFLGVCRGTVTLKTVIEEALKYSDRAIARFGEKTDAVAFILTDKWDPKAFKKYKKDLVRNAADHGIWYVFILVTDYGYVQIPFLPNRRGEFDEWVFSAAGKDEIPVLTEPIVYSVSGGFLNLREEYVFDLEHMTWKRNSSYRGDASGRLPKSPVIRFMNEVRKLSGKDIFGRSFAAFDAETKELKVPGFLHANWNECDVSGEDADPALCRLEKAIGDLLKRIGA